MKNLYIYILFSSLLHTRERERKILCYMILNLSHSSFFFVLFFCSSKFFSFFYIYPFIFRSFFSTYFLFIIFIYSMPFFAFFLLYSSFYQEQYQFSCCPLLFMPFTLCFGYTSLLSILRCLSHCLSQDIFLFYLFPHLHLIPR